MQREYVQKVTREQNSGKRLIFIKFCKSVCKIYEGLNAVQILFSNLLQ